MRKDQLQEAFSQLHASDELVMEVLDLKQVSKQNKPVWRIVARVAAMAAAVAIVVAAWLLWPEEETPGAQLGTPTEGTTVTPTMPTEVPPETLPKTYYAAPGILKVYAGDVKNMDAIQKEEQLLIEMEPSYKTAWSPIVNLLCAGVRLTLVVDEESLLEHEITYDISVNYGELCDTVDNINAVPGHDGTQVWGKTHVAVNGEAICWDGGELLDLMSKEEDLFENKVEDLLTKIDEIYMRIIIKADGNIVGYTVIEMVCTNVNLCLFNAMIVESGCFPKVDGEFQNVTEEYVRDLVTEKMASFEM